MWPATSCVGFGPAEFPIVTGPVQVAVTFGRIIHTRHRRTVYWHGLFVHSTRIWSFNPWFCLVQPNKIWTFNSWVYLIHPTRIRTFNTWVNFVSPYWDSNLEPLGLFGSPYRDLNLEPLELLWKMNYMYSTIYLLWATLPPFGLKRYFMGYIAPTQVLSCVMSML